MSGVFIALVSIVSVMDAFILAVALALGAVFLLGLMVWSGEL
jgi:hypothetical protein